jgi:glycerol-3-phosphate acyltransferase PlsX
MSTPAVVAIDAMGGDAGPAATVPAAFAALADNPTLELRLVGREADLMPLVDRGDPGLRGRIELVPATEVIAMDDTPAEALRRKRDSSMRLALEDVKAGRAQACVSAGNTGALMAVSRFVLKTLPGVDRPAIISAIPSIGGHTYMLDLGANANCTPEQLLQFAVMGTVVAADLRGIERPSVGLLNIGTEAIKGNETLRQAGRLLERSDLNYIGFIEGHDIVSGRVDVVVTDGFTGNVALKTMEGMARMLAEAVRREVQRSWLNRLIGAAARHIYRGLRFRLDPRRHNGASLVGLQGIVIKSHGGADEVAFQNAIRTAVVEIDKGVPTHIGELLARQTDLEKAV